MKLFAKIFDLYQKVSPSKQNAFHYFLITLPILFSFQNCGSQKFNSQMVDLSSNASKSLGVVPPICSPTQSRVCKENNGVGFQFCEADGSPKTCQIESCESGFSFKNGKCEPQSCKPTTTASCEGLNGSGVRTCNSDGLGFGACVLNKCSVGYELDVVTKICKPLACVPNTSLGCNIANGVGLQTCKSDGSGYMGCKLQSCDTGYKPSGDFCVASCTAGEKQTCSENNGSGARTCLSSGSGYGACQLNACNDGYNLQNGVCIANLCPANTFTSCTGQYGSGIHTCNSMGTGYGVCEMKTCLTGYALVGVNCIPKICEANKTSACSLENGSGEKMCNATGTGFGACEVKPSPNEIKIDLFEFNSFIIGGDLYLTNIYNFPAFRLGFGSKLIQKIDTNVDAVNNNWWYGICYSKYDKLTDSSKVIGFGREPRFSFTSSAFKGRAKQIICGGYLNQATVLTETDVVYIRGDKGVVQYNLDLIFQGYGTSPSRPRFSAPILDKIPISPPGGPPVSSEKRMQFDQIFRPADSYYGSNLFFFLYSKENQAIVQVVISSNNDNKISGHIQNIDSNVTDFSFSDFSKTMSGAFRTDIGKFCYSVINQVKCISRYSLAPIIINHNKNVKLVSLGTALGDENLTRLVCLVDIDDDLFCAKTWDDKPVFFTNIKDLNPKQIRYNQGTLSVVSSNKLSAIYTLNPNKFDMFDGPLTFKKELQIDFSTFNPQ